MELCTNSTIQDHGNSNTRRSNDNLCSSALCFHHSKFFKPTIGMASLQLNPTDKMALAVCHVPRLKTSVAQYAIHVHKVQV